MLALTTLTRAMVAAEFFVKKAGSVRRAGIDMHTVEN